MPTIGQVRFFFGTFERDFCATGLARADFVRFAFARERDALVDVGFAAMAFHIMNRDTPLDKTERMLKMTKRE